MLGATHDREPKLWGPYTERDPFHDPFTMFSYLAAITERIELVTGVLILPQRQTALAAQQAADVDLLSAGRLRLGVGTGWNYVEYDALGQDFARRGPRLDEQIGLMRRLWSEPLVSFEGTFDKVDRANINPRPRRRIPIWVGGFSEPAFRRGGRFGDGFIFAGRIDRCVEAIGSVRGHLAAAGRSADDFGLEYIGTSLTSVDQVRENAAAWRAAGGTHLSIVTMGMGLDSIEGHVDYLGRALEAVERS